MKQISILLIIFLNVLLLNGQQKSYSQLDSIKVEFHNQFNRKLAEEMGKDTTYNYSNARCIMIFFSFDSIGKLDFFQTIGQTQQKYDFIYKDILDSLFIALKTKNLFLPYQYTYFQSVNEIFADTFHKNQEIPTFTYNKYAPKDIVSTYPIPYWAFSLLVNQRNLENCFKQCEKKPLMMLRHINVQYKSNGHTTIHLVPRRASTN